MSEKEYFSIKEVADMLTLKPYILRYWEKEFAVLFHRLIRYSAPSY